MPALFAVPVGWAAISLMIFLANLEAARGQRPPLAGALNYGLAGAFLIWSLSALPADADRAGLSLIAVAAAAAILSARHLARRLRPLIVRLSLKEAIAFDPRHPVHRLALTLMIFHIASVLWRARIGLDFAYADVGAALLDLGGGALIYLSAALLGVGWGLRRDARALWQRLGLRVPQRRDWLAGIAAALLLYLLAGAATALWASGVSPADFAEQTRAAQHLFSIFRPSLLAGLLLALLSASSEEVLFRGALQPVFGILPTALFFALSHLQYAATPALLIVLLLGLGFGLLRKRISTTAAIIAHALYNLLPFLLFSLSGSA